MKERGTFKVHYQNLDRTLRLGTIQRTSEILLKGAFFFSKMEPALVEKQLETLHTKSKPSPSHCTLIKRT